MAAANWFRGAGARGACHHARRGEVAGPVERARLWELPSTLAWDTPRPACLLLLAMRGGGGQQGWVRQTGDQLRGQH